MTPTKRRILDDARLERLAREHGTPLFVYDAGIIRARIAELAGFDAIRYAQKANSNLAILGLVREQGVVVDAVSAGEGARALRAGLPPADIAFTPDLFHRAPPAVLLEHPLPVNPRSPGMLRQYAPLPVGTENSLPLNPGLRH